MVREQQLDRWTHRTLWCLLLPAQTCHYYDSFSLSILFFGWCRDWLTLLICLYLLQQQIQTFCSMMDATTPRPVFGVRSPHWCELVSSDASPICVNMWFLTLVRSDAHKKWTILSCLNLKVTVKTYCCVVSCFWALLVQQHCTVIINWSDHLIYDVISEIVISERCLTFWDSRWLQRMNVSSEEKSGLDEREREYMVVFEVFTSQRPLSSHQRFQKHVYRELHAACQSA